MVPVTAEEETPAEGWDADPLKAAVENKAAKVHDNSPEAVLWRATTRLMDCLPADIIPVHENMAVESTIFATGERTAPDMTIFEGAGKFIWLATFCKALTNVLLHPDWLGEPRLLTVAIQYTVICATDDVRP